MGMRIVRMIMAAGLGAGMWSGGFSHCMGAESAEPVQDGPVLLDVRKIWDRAEHSAFTDLIRFRGRWFCTFREADKHVGGRDGQIRVIHSKDGGTWESAVLIAEEGVDLRDPKLSVTPDGRLMIVTGGSVYRQRRLVGRQPRVCFSEDGRRWSRPIKVCEPGDWLWRVTWHDGQAWGGVYRATDDGDWPLVLVSSRDGVHYERAGSLEVAGRPNETTLRFAADGTMVALVRREGGDRQAMIGTARPPYTQWRWHEAGYRIGGPNFIVLPDGRMWAAGRFYSGGPRTVLARLTTERYEPVLTLPSGGDTSYPGLVWHAGVLWISYYSSHEGRACIYLARVRVPEGPGSGFVRSGEISGNGM